MLDKLNALYWYLRAGVASLIGLGILVAGLYQNGSGSGSDLVCFIVVFFFCQFFSFRMLRSARDAEYQHGFQARLEAKKAQLREAERRAAGPSLVNASCAQCGTRITIVWEGTACEHCETPIHRDCAAAHVHAEHGSAAAFR